MPRHPGDDRLLPCPAPHSGQQGQRQDGRLHGAPGDLLPSPSRLCVIGGGVIGVEFASLFSALGSVVTVIEMMDEIVPFMDKEQAPLLRRAMKGVDFKLGCKVEKLEGGTVHFSTKAGVAEKVEADLVLMAVGRRPNLSGWGAESVGIDSTNRGVNTDDRQRTNIPGIWAAGDITGRSVGAGALGLTRMAEVAVSDIVASLDGTAPSANRDALRRHPLGSLRHTRSLGRRHDRTGSGKQGHHHKEGIPYP
ncbi:hypothetical protein MASR2M78_27570 [Treponema sp.]